MKKVNIIKLTATVVCILVLLLAPINSFAAIGVDEGALSVVFKHEEKPISGVTFRLYHIGRPSSDGYVLTDKFSSYSVSMKNLDSNGLNSLATTLSAYIARDSVAPDAQGETNQYGSYKFATLPLGIYLVTGDNYTDGNVTYIPKPFVVIIPTENDNGNLMYEIAAEPKYDLREDNGKNEKTERRALKIWNDSEYSLERPKSIVVQLLCDGKIYSEINLNAENNWGYTWSNLDAAHTWQLTEKEVPNDYSVSVEQKELTFSVTNTFEGDIPETGTKTPGKDSSLPKTGQLWWPVPVLLFSGIIISILGLKIRRNGENFNA